MNNYENICINGKKITEIVSWDINLLEVSGTMNRLQINCKTSSNLMTTDFEKITEVTIGDKILFKVANIDVLTLIEINGQIYQTLSCFGNIVYK